jgi:putative MFS transporter
LLSEGWTTIELNGWFQSITMTGYLIGALISGVVGDHLGRRKALLTFVAIFIGATFLAAFSPNMIVLIAFRGLMGIGLGAFIPCGYGPFGEYIPPQKRNKYSGYIGLIANFSPPLGAALTMIVIPAFGWRPIFFGISALGLIVWILLLKFMPESPRWLASKGRNDEADAIVSAAEQSFINKGIELPEISEEQVKAIEAEAGKEPVQLPYRALFSKKMIRRTITASAALMAMNVIVYTITTWTPTVLVMQGFDTQYSIFMTFIALCGAPFGIFLLSLFGNKHPRKVGMIVLLLVLAVAGYVWSLQTEPIVIMITGFVLCTFTYYYALLACSVYLGEAFPTEIRLRGSGFSNAMGRIAAIVTPTIVAALLQSSGVVTVYAFVGVCMVVFAVIIGICGIETRNKTLEEINDSVMSE